LLPTLGQALADGLVHRGHIDAATSSLLDPRSGTSAVVDDEGTTGAIFADRLLTEVSLATSPGTVEHLGRVLKEHLHPGREDRFDAEHYRRSGRFVVDPASDPEVMAVFEHGTAPAMLPGRCATTGRP